MGIDKTLGATLVSIIGGVSGSSRALFGLVGDRPCVDRVVLSGMSGAVAGTLTSLSTLLTDYPQMAAYSVLLGIASGRSNARIRKAGAGEFEPTHIPALSLVISTARNT